MNKADEDSRSLFTTNGCHTRTHAHTLTIVVTFSLLFSVQLQDTSTTKMSLPSQETMDQYLSNRWNVNKWIIM